MFFFFNDTATTEIYTLSLHDALPIFRVRQDEAVAVDDRARGERLRRRFRLVAERRNGGRGRADQDRESTRLNSSHPNKLYVVFFFKKKKYIQSNPMFLLPTTLFYLFH